jgi:hypothetical protein
MGSKSPEQELEEFLAAKPSWLRKILRLEHDDLTKEEKLAWQQSEWWWKDIQGTVEDEYLRLLKRCPAKWNERCRRLKEQAVEDLPSGLPGRPTKDALAQEATELKQHLSYPKVAKRLNEKYGAGTTTAGAIRQLIRSRKPPSGSN